MVVFGQGQGIFSNVHTAKITANSQTYTQEGKDTRQQLELNNNTTKEKCRDI